MQFFPPNQYPYIIPVTTNLLLHYVCNQSVRFRTVMSQDRASRSNDCFYWYAAPINGRLPFLETILYLSDKWFIFHAV